MTISDQDAAKATAVSVDRGVAAIASAGMLNVVAVANSGRSDVWDLHARTICSLPQTAAVFPWQDCGTVAVSPGTERHPGQPALWIVRIPGVSDSDNTDNLNQPDQDTRNLNRPVKRQKTVPSSIPDIDKVSVARIDQQSKSTWSLLATSWTGAMWIRPSSKSTATNTHVNFDSDANQDAGSGLESVFCTWTQLNRMTTKETSIQSQSKCTSSQPQFITQYDLSMEPDTTSCLVFNDTVTPTCALLIESSHPKLGSTHHESSTIHYPDRYPNACVLGPMLSASLLSPRSTNRDTDSDTMSSLVMYIRGALVSHPNGTLYSVSFHPKTGSVVSSRVVDVMPSRVVSMHAVMNGHAVLVVSSDMVTMIRVDADAQLSVKHASLMSSVADSVVIRDSTEHQYDLTNHSIDLIDMDIDTTPHRATNESVALVTNTILPHITYFHVSALISDLDASVANDTLSVYPILETTRIRHDAHLRCGVIGRTRSTIHTVSCLWTGSPHVCVGGLSDMRVNLIAYHDTGSWCLVSVSMDIIYRTINMLEDPSIQCLVDRITEMDRYRTHVTRMIHKLVYTLKRVDRARSVVSRIGYPTTHDTDTRGDGVTIQCTVDPRVVVNDDGLTCSMVVCVSSAQEIRVGSGWFVSVCIDHAHRGVTDQSDTETMNTDGVVTIPDMCGTVTKFMPIDVIPSADAPWTWCLGVPPCKFPARVTVSLVFVDTDTMSTGASRHRVQPIMTNTVLYTSVVHAMAFTVPVSWCVGPKLHASDWTSRHKLREMIDKVVQAGQHHLDTNRTDPYALVNDPTTMSNDAMDIGQYSVSMTSQTMRVGIPIPNTAYKIRDTDTHTMQTIRGVVVPILFAQVMVMLGRHVSTYHHHQQHDSVNGQRHRGVIVPWHRMDQSTHSGESITEYMCTGVSGQHGHGDIGIRLPPFEESDTCYMRISSCSISDAVVIDLCDDDGNDATVDGGMRTLTCEIIVSGYSKRGVESVVSVMNEFMGADASTNTNLDSDDGRENASRIVGQAIADALAQIHQTETGST